MNYPGVPGRPMGVGSGNTPGMNEQEQAIVKAVSYMCVRHSTLPRADHVADASSNGELRG